MPSKPDLPPIPGTTFGCQESLASIPPIHDGADDENSASDIEVESNAVVEREEDNERRDGEETPVYISEHGNMYYGTVLLDGRWKGNVKYWNGDTYTGTFAPNLMKDGKGTYVFHSSENATGIFHKLECEFHCDRPFGKAVFSFFDDKQIPHHSNLSFSEQGLLEGKVTFESEQGHINWTAITKNGQLNGSRVVYLSNGYTCQQGWSNNKLQSGPSDERYALGVIYALRILQIVQLSFFLLLRLAVAILFPLLFLKSPVWSLVLGETLYAFTAPLPLSFLEMAHNDAQDNLNPWSYLAIVGIVYIYLCAGIVLGGTSLITALTGIFPGFAGNSVGKLPISVLKATRFGVCFHACFSHIQVFIGLIVPQCVLLLTAEFCTTAPGTVGQICGWRILSDLQAFLLVLILHFVAFSIEIPSSVLTTCINTFLYNAERFRMLIFLLSSFSVTFATTTLSLILYVVTFFTEYKYCLTFWSMVAFLLTEMVISFLIQLLTLIFMSRNVAKVFGFAYLAWRLISILMLFRGEVPLVEAALALFCSRIANIGPLCSGSSVCWTYDLISDGITMIWIIPLIEVLLVITIFAILDSIWSSEFETRLNDARAQYASEFVRSSTGQAKMMEDMLLISDENAADWKILAVGESKQLVTVGKKSPRVTPMLMASFLLGRQVDPLMFISYLHSLLAMIIGAVGMMIARLVLQSLTGFDLHVFILCSVLMAYSLSEIVVSLCLLFISTAGKPPKVIYSVTIIVWRLLGILLFVWIAVNLASYCFGIPLVIRSEYYDQVRYFFDLGMVLYFAVCIVDLLVAFIFILMHLTVLVRLIPVVEKSITRGVSWIQWLKQHMVLPWGA